ncbi:Galacturonosyltransferase 8 [Citrus sinensis]|nr:Galacturonosyltransferase 8 [Citrus sinensis]
MPTMEFDFISNRSAGSNWEITLTIFLFFTSSLLFTFLTLAILGLNSTLRTRSLLESSLISPEITRILLLNPTYRAAMESDSLTINESILRQFEKEVKKRINLTGYIIAEKLKDTIFTMNEQLTKAKKQGAFLKRIVHPENYNEEGKPTHAEFEDPKLYHNNSKEPWKHVFLVVMDQMNLGAIQVMLKFKDYNGAHLGTKAVGDYKFLNSHMSLYATNLKFRNPNYLLILYHLRFWIRFQ